MVHSHIFWLDYSEKERRKMLDIFHALDEKDTIDEHGLGSIRDAIADRFLPGTGTVQTRARYLFFISWMYMALEEKRVSSAKIADKARNEELHLVEMLLDKGVTEGVIGRVTRRKLPLLPSKIYRQRRETLGLYRLSSTQMNSLRICKKYYLCQRAHVAKRTLMRR
ncbi:hypothetical protein KQI65_09830 [bacterium]|nr:hypothetical protein [bacterium]